MEQLYHIFDKIDRQRSTKRILDQFNRARFNRQIISKSCSNSFLFSSQFERLSGPSSDSILTPDLDSFLSQFNPILPLPITIQLEFKSAEVCARIIGRSGKLIREIRHRTGTIVESPKIVENQSTKTFEIIGRSVRGVLSAALAIQQLGVYFDQQINDLASPDLRADEIRLDVGCSPEAVSCVLFGRGRFVIELACQNSVRIISPKPYSNQCCFKVIGTPMNVIIACMKLRRLIIYMTEKYGSKTLITPPTSPSYSGKT